MFSTSTRQRVLKRIRLNDLLGILSENESETASVASSQSLSTKSVSSLNSGCLNDLLEKVDGLSIADLVEAIILKLISISNLSKTQINDVISAFKLLLMRLGIQTSCMPKSAKSFWNKHCDKSIIEYWIYCSSSHAHGPLKGEPRLFPSLQCEDSEISTELKLGSYSVHYSLSTQLEQILYAFHPINYALSSEIVDIIDGKRLISLKISERDQLVDSCYTLTLLTDELPVSNSSSMRVFPAFIQLNELSLEHRKANLMLTTVFYGQKKPKNSNAYLKPLLSELMKLSTSGLVWRDKDSNVHRSIFKLSTVIADAPMRAYLRGMMQYNSTFGCDWCRVMGHSLHGSMKFFYYPRQQIDALERFNQEFHLGSMNIFLNEATRRSFRHSSDLIMLPDFDIVWSFSVEILHAAFLGVVRDMISKAWLNPESRGKPYFIGDIKSIRRIDARLLAIKVTSNVVRKPRSISLLKQWKGNELAAFLCYYAYPVLHGILKHRFILHFGLLAETILLLQKGPISEANLERATQCIYQFHHLLQELYGPEFMTYNAHILLHLPKSVKNLGPASFISAFISENEMGKLKRSVRQYQTTSQNLVNLHLIYNAYRAKVNNELRNASYAEKKFFFDIKNIVTCSPSHLPKKPLTQKLCHLLHDMRYESSLINSLSLIQAVWYKNKWITTRDYDTRHIKENHFVELKSGRYFEVIQIMHSTTTTLLAGYLIKPHEQAFKIYKAFEDSDPIIAIYHNIHEIKSINTDLTIIEAKDVLGTVIFTSFDEKLIVKPCLKWL